MSGLRVLDRRCDECLYSPDKIVSDVRRKDILRKITREDGRFECHKGSILGEAIHCRGDWDARLCGQLGRIMGRLNAVEFVSADEIEARVKAKLP